MNDQQAIIELDDGGGKPSARRLSGIDDQHLKQDGQAIQPNGQNGKTSARSHQMIKSRGDHPGPQNSDSLDARLSRKEIVSHTQPQRKRRVSGCEGRGLTLEVKPTIREQPVHQLQRVAGSSSAGLHQNEQNSQSSGCAQQPGASSGVRNRGSQGRSNNHAQANIVQEMLNRLKPNNGRNGNQSRQGSGQGDPGASQDKLRNVHVDVARLPQHDLENYAFAPNGISTTKYSLLSFLPKALFIQFKRMSNVYFLSTAIMTTIPGFSPITPASTFVPLTFVILMSMMREAYEDYKRRRNDQLTNNRKCRVLRDPNAFKEHKFFTGEMKKEDLEKDGDAKWNPQNCQNMEEMNQLKACFNDCLWSEVKCGDLILLEEEENLPADCIFLMSSAENGECFVQTATLDGERALKHKQCLVPIKKAIEMYGLNNFQCNFNCEAPAKNLYEFSGFVESEQLPEKGTINLRVDSKRRTITIDNKQLGLRGSNIANTTWAIGAAVYTGRDSKLMLNQGNSRFKQSRIETVVNQMCIYLIIAQAVFCTIMSVFSGYYVSNYAKLSSDGLRRKAEYIFYTELSQFGRSMNGTAADNSNIEYSPAAEGFMTYGVYFILLNTIIPLSLVVSIEIIKLTQGPFMAHDVKMYDETSMKHCQPMSMTLHEEMASISYIFADKTGTLTANVMQFKACSIGSVCYDEEYRDEDYEYLMDDDSDDSVTPVMPRSPEADAIREEDINLKQVSMSNMSPDEYLLFKEKNMQNFNEVGKEAKTRQRRGSITKIVWNFPEAQMIIKNLLQRNRYFINEETNLGQSKPEGHPLIMRKQNEYLHQFWLNVALCHDVITTVQTKQDTGQKVRTYQGTSPDEITLLDAAKEVGYTFLDRTSESMLITIFEQPKTYRLLQKFEFTSERKKMTVIVQDETNGQIVLYTKGADLAIFDRLSQQLEQHFLDATKEDLIKFSTKGFRTLCFGIRVLDEQYFKEWQHRYESAKLESIKLGASKVEAGIKGAASGAADPNALLLSLQHELESEIFLLGATALEDKLQDGVPEAIEDFRNAGIKVWMLTGDKLETAENIGFSSKMFNEKMYIFKLQTPDKASTRQRLLQIDNKIFEIEKKHATPVIGTQFILNPNAAMESYEARNVIRALEEFKHESKASEHTMNDSWARKPTLKRKMRKRLEEIVPDRNAIAERLIRESQVFFKTGENQMMQYVPPSFDLKGGQYIFKGVNVYRSAASQKMKLAKQSSGMLQVGGINLNLMQTMNLQNTSKEGIIDNEDKFGILIEGHTLAFIQDSKSMKEKFLKILAKCEAVVVCRASPSQKGQVVEMIKQSEPEAVTLAIGDGANDVNMIQKAHVGIGIFGKEGYQAAGSSDYAIGQFRFLRRLLFVHGRWNGLRLTIFMLLFFNKNLFFTIPQFWFGWNNGYSGQSYYDETYMSAFNMFATNFAICGFAVWEQDIDVNDPSQQAMIDLFMPQIYQYTKENELFTTKKFIGWSAVSIMQSLFMYGIPQFTYDSYIFEGGKKQDFWAQSMCSYFSLVVLHYAISFFFTRNWTVWLTFLYIVSIAFFAPFQVLIYDSLSGVYPMAGRLREIAFSDFRFWLTIFVTVALCLIPFLFYFQANSLLFPSLKDLIIQGQLDPKSVVEEADPQKAKEAMDILKKKQAETLQIWDQEYNTFKAPPAAPSNIAQQAGFNPPINDAPPPPQQLISLVNQNNATTPQKASINSPWRKAPPAGSKPIPTVLEQIIEEEAKLPIEEEVMPFKILENDHQQPELRELKLTQKMNDTSPLRMSASRKGLNFVKQGKNDSLLFKPQGIADGHPKLLSPIGDEEEPPLRITQSGATPSPIKDPSSSPDTQLRGAPSSVLPAADLQSEDFLHSELDHDASQLDMQMQIIKQYSKLEVLDGGGQMDSAAVGHVFKNLNNQSFNYSNDKKNFSNQDQSI